MDMYTKEQLDTRICDLEQGAENTQTLREFIRSSEEYFEFPSSDIDNLDTQALSEYLDFLDYLWTK